MYIKTIKESKNEDYGFKYKHGYVFGNSSLSATNSMSFTKSEFYVIYGANQGVIYDYKLQKFMLSKNVKEVMLLQQKGDYVYLSPYKFNDDRYNNKQKAFSCRFLWSTSSDFMEELSNYPLPIHDLEV